MTSPTLPLEADPIASARSRVQNTPIPDWADECTYDAGFKSENATQTTCLLFDTQIHVERHELFAHHVIRLETIEAVQHWSQWRVQFEPKTQMVNLHFLKVRRGDVEIDQSNIEKAHLLQREEGLDRFVIHGWFTLLMVLEDVRPGDILDFAYTIETQTSIFPEHGSYLFTLPQGVSAGKYHFAARFDPSRQRKWRSSSPNLTPRQTVKDGLTFWEWQGENYIGQKPEVNTPPWHISHLWIQISDFPSWQMIAVGLSKVWTNENGGEALAEMAREIERMEADLPARIEKAIRFVQDECRYMSVNLEFGGQIPTPSETVARRRFGDCKDLSFLLANLLKKLGVKARPILVNAFVRKSVDDFLPTPSLFNHVIVEFEAEGKRRWIDPTFKEQGGGAFNRSIPNFGLGLPVDENAAGLSAQPQIELSHLFNLREHLLLDTAGAPSSMEVTLRAEGNPADNLRLQLKKYGMEEMARQRLQAMAGRFGNANRVGSIQYRDDQAANCFVLTEVFEIKFPLGSHPNPKFCRVNLPANWLAHVLLMPQKKERRAPFALPHPCQIHYVADVESHGIKKTKITEPHVDVNSSFIQFTKTSKTGNGYFLMEYSLATNAESVPAEQVQKHAEVVERIVRACARELSLLRGYASPRPKSEFGKLPSSEKKILPESRANTEELPAQIPMQTAPVQYHRRKRKRIPKGLIWIMGIIAIITIYILFILLLKRLRQD